MEWMTTEEFFSYKILKHLNDNRGDDGVSSNEMLKSFQITPTEIILNNIIEMLVKTGMIAPASLTGARQYHFKITLLGEERYNLIATQIRKLNEGSITDNKIKDLTIENYNEKWKFFWAGSAQGFIVAIVSGLLVWWMTKPNQEIPLQTKTEILNIPQVVVVHDTIYTTKWDTVRIATKK